MEQTASKYRRLDPQLQEFQDQVLLDAVDDVEDLTAGFSRKIWQKITILETLGRTLPVQFAAEEKSVAVTAASVTADGLR